MIESSTSTVQKSPPQKAPDIILNTAVGIGVGVILGEGADIFVPIKDEYVKKYINENLSKKVIAKEGYDLREMAKDFIHKERSYKWGNIGAVTFGGVALVYSLLKSSQIKKAEQ
jgi:hypothetical protein